ncbi:MAG: S41 family peptidase, partial [Pseudomonadota bacterium]
DTLLVVSVLDNGPSAKAGLIKGDKIIAVNDTTIAGKKIPQEQIFKKLRGKGGTSVKVNLLRNHELISKNITRGSIPNPSLNAAYMLNETVGYIKLERFSSTTYKEFIDAMNDLKKHGLKKLILDLRDNGGGYLEEATEIADEFISENKILVYTQGRVFGKEEFKARVAGVFEEGDLVLLINEGSASASEVIAGCLQDYDRATIVGARSFGKGLVQHQYKLSNGGYLRLTVAKYYTPSGRCIQKSYRETKDAYYHEVLERNDSVQFISATDTTTYFTASGKKVYGGGGITPDVMVKQTSILTNAMLEKVLGNISFQEIAYGYALANQTELMKSFPTEKEFISNYKVSDDLIKLALKDQKDLTIGEEAKNYIIMRIKSSMARYLFDNNAFFEAQAKDDVVLMKGLEVISNMK